MLRPPTILVGGLERCHRSKAVLDHLDRDAYIGGRTGGRYLRSVEAPEGWIIHNTRFLEEKGDGFEGVRDSIRYSLAFRQSSCVGEMVVA